MLDVSLPLVRMKIAEIGGEQSEAADEQHPRKAGVEVMTRHRHCGQGQWNQPQRVAAHVEGTATIDIRGLGKDEEEPNARDSRAEHGESKLAVLQTGVPERSRKQREAGESEERRDRHPGD